MMDATTSRQRWKWTPERLLEFQTYITAAHAADPGDDFGTIAKRWLETLPAQLVDRLIGQARRHALARGCDAVQGFCESDVHGRHSATALTMEATAS